MTNRPYSPADFLLFLGYVKNTQQHVFGTPSVYRSPVMIIFPQ